MREEPLDYPQMVRRALLRVVGDALRHVSEEGFPGEHHFYLTFQTDVPGVEVPAFLRSKHPDEMTIVLQHQFRDLAVDEQVFSVTLRFDGKPQHLVVPFEALRAFVDPEAHFGLRFDPPGSETEATPEITGKDESKEPVVPTGNVVDLGAFRRAQQTPPGPKRGEDSTS